MSSKCNVCSQANALGLPLTRNTVSLNGKGYRLRLCTECADRLTAAVMSMAWYSGDADEPLEFNDRCATETEAVPVHAMAASASAGPRVRPQDIRVNFPVIRRDHIEVVERAGTVASSEALDGLSESVARELVETYTMTNHVRAQTLQGDMLPIRVMYAAHFGTTCETKADGTLVRECGDLVVMLNPKTNRIVKAYRNH